MASIKPRNLNGKIVLDQLNKKLFVQNIIESRKSQGENITNFSFNKSRCKVLSASDETKINSNGIIYWMSRDCRVQDNWAFLFAQRLALKQRSPLYVCFICKDAHRLYPTKRHFTFLLEGLKIVERECRDLNIGFYLLNSSAADLAKLCISNNIGAVVCDFNPLRYTKQMQNELLNNLPNDIPVVQVDAHNIVPAWEASNKQEGMAKFLRPKITKKLAEYLTGFPEVCNHSYTGELNTNQRIRTISDAYTIFKPVWDVLEVKWCDGYSADAGIDQLFTFMTENLRVYGIESNDPSKDCTSKLSPWLHFGQISAQRCALEIKSLELLYKEQCEKFLEELIVRKELSDNYCYYNNDYDNINGAANWAKETLSVHKSDKRAWIYSREQLEKAQTHDEMWNAAQLQAIENGKIHGYMRMYWCKKILEWTESPEKAIEYSLWLNDIYCLDGTDPNGYVGVMWSICGVHDQGWKERPIFGKIRYMVDYSLKRKYDMDAYCARFGRKKSKDVHKDSGKLKSSKAINNSNGRKRGVKRKTT